jgi:hypothetical protein
MADVISFAEIARDRRRARERAATEACLQLLEANLQLALQLFATASPPERPWRARQLRQLAELLEYVTHAA